jgi:hypothetical protein
MTATLELMPNVGDWVLLKKMVRENKLSALYAEGLLKVVTINSNVNFTIKRRKKEIRVHFNLLIPYENRKPNQKNQIQITKPRTKRFLNTNTFTILFSELYVLVFLSCMLALRAYISTISSS